MTLPFLRDYLAVQHFAAFFAMRCRFSENNWHLLGHNPSRS
jgi:hypothetical protein